MSNETLLGIVVLAVAVIVILLIRSRSEQRQDEAGGVMPQAGAPRVKTQIKFNVTTSAPGPSEPAHSAVHMSTKLVSQHLQGPEKQVLENWLGVTGGEWTEEQKTKFAAAFERFIWDGEGLSFTLKGVSMMLRSQYPQVSGTPLDVEIPPDVRAIMAKLTGSSAAAH